MIFERKHFLEKVNIIEKLGLDKDGLYLVFGDRGSDKWSWIDLNEKWEDYSLKIHGDYWSEGYWRRIETLNNITERHRQSLGALASKFRYSNHTNADSTMIIKARAYNGMIDNFYVYSSKELLSQPFDMYIIRDGKVDDLVTKRLVFAVSGTGTGIRSTEINLGEYIPGIRISLDSCTREKMQGINIKDAEILSIHIMRKDEEYDENERVTIRIDNGKECLLSKDITEPLKAFDKELKAKNSFHISATTITPLGILGICPPWRWGFKLAKESEHDGNYGLAALGESGDLSGFTAEFRVDNDDKLSRLLLWNRAQDENINVTVAVTDGKGNVIAEKKYDRWEERDRQIRQISVLGSWIVVKSGIRMSIMDRVNMCTNEYFIP